MRATRRRRWVRRLGALGLAVTLTLAAIEVLLRLLSPQPVIVLNFGDLYEPDPTTGYRLRPRTVIGDIHINSLGFRDREYAVAKPPQTVRIVVLGDSFTFGTGRQGEVYGEVAEEILTSELPSPPVYEVWSVGVPGWGTAEELEWLRRDGLACDPDLVVLGFYVGNDVLDNLELGEKVVIEGRIVGRDALAHGEFTRKVLIGASSFLHRLHLYRLLRIRVFGLEHADVPMRMARQDTPRAEWEAPPLSTPERERRAWRLGRGMLATAPPPAVSRGWTETERILGEMAELLRERSVGFLVLVIPAWFQVDPSVLERLEELREGHGDLDLALPQRRVAEICRSLEIPVLDVLEAFQRAARVEALYDPRDTHWNVAGNRLAASLLVEALEEGGELAR